MAHELGGNVKSTLLNFVISELCKSPSYHVYDYMKNEVCGNGLEMTMALMAACESNVPKDTCSENSNVNKHGHVNVSQCSTSAVAEMQFDSALLSGDTYFRNNFRMNKQTVEVRKLIQFM